MLKHLRACELIARYYNHVWINSKLFIIIRRKICKVFHAITDILSVPSRCDSTTRIDRITKCKCLGGCAWFPNRVFFGGSCQQEWPPYWLIAPLWICHLLRKTIRKLGANTVLLKIRSKGGPKWKGSKNPNAANCPPFSANCQSFGVVYILGEQLPVRVDDQNQVRFLDMCFFSYRNLGLQFLEFGQHTVDGRNPKQPPAMYKTP